MFQKERIDNLCDKVSELMRTVESQQREISMLKRVLMDDLGLKVRVDYFCWGGTETGKLEKWDDLLKHLKIKWEVKPPISGFKSLK